MFRIDHPTRAAALPSPDPVASQGFFTKGDPTMAVPATRVTQDWLNAVQEELANAIEAEGVVLDKGDRRQLSRALQRTRGGSGFSNLIQNPEFDVAQRGTTIAINPGNPGSGTFALLRGPDRWRYRLGDATDEGTWSTTIDAINTLGDVPNSGATSYATLQRNGTSSSGVRPAIEQAIEGVHLLSGEPVVLAFDCRKHQVSDPVGDIELVELIQVFGQTGSPSAPVTTVLSSPLTGYDGTWRRFTFTGVLPSISGKTITNGHHLLLRIHFTDQTATARVDVTGFVMQRGTIDPGYTSRGRVLETLLCSRYFESSRYGDGAVPTLAFTAGCEEVGLWDTAFDGAGKVRTLGRRFLVPKYARNASVVLPTVTWRGTNGSDDFVTEGASTHHPVTSADVTFDHSGFPEITSPPAGGTLRQFRGYFYAEAEILA